MKHTESELQKGAVALVNYMAGGAVLFVNPYAGFKSSPKTAARAKALGFRAGLPDLFLALRSGPYGGLAIELKAPDVKLAPRPGAQYDTLKRLKSDGYAVALINDLTVLRRLLEAYLNGRPLLDLLWDG